MSATSFIPTVSRAAGIIVHDGKILLIHRIKNGNEYFVIPGGTIEPGETAQQACVRELFEETSLRCHVQREFAAFAYDATQQFYFVCEAESAEARLGVGPERERMKEGENWYSPEWIDMMLLEKIPLLPPEIKDKILLERNDLKKISSVRDAREL